MDKNIRVRFAPSPTGFLHIGSLRTVLFNYVFAKKYKGKFILRIEDTDEKRKVEGSVENLISIFDWLGLDYDEGPNKDGGFGPYTQSERNPIYLKYVEQLLEEKKAYKCFCTAERLQEMREEQQENKRAPRYDGKCRDLNDSEIEANLANNIPFVVRQKIPESGEIIVHDELKGEIKFQTSELDDHVLLKTTGTPTYQFANVIDDHLMEISHVMRGDEWIPSSPKNVLLYKDLGWEAPKFIHLPLIMNKEGGKLSKRQGDVTVEAYKEKGYLPEALINFSALLGWHPKGDNEILNLEEIIENFSIDGMGISPGVFDIDKLDFFNSHYMKELNSEKLLELSKPYIVENLEITKKDSKKKDDFLLKVIKTEKERVKKLSDLGEATKFFFFDDLDYEPSLLIWKSLEQTQVKENLEKVYELVDKIPEENWTEVSINDAVYTYIKSSELKVGDYLWPMRVALSGQEKSPGPFEIAEVLGKSETLLKIQKAITILS
ncbi:MAG: glutamate--tRNA ligase [Patescibacteria group bacterium]|jgi:nondiscriminating glutamyl-tRNA synthetase|nr:glutamate--tRNA ligase [Patescibacteria group bacterium]